MSKESIEKQTSYPPLDEQNRYAVETADGLAWVPQETWDRLQADPQAMEEFKAPIKMSETPEEQEAYLRTLGLDPNNLFD